MLQVPDRNTKALLDLADFLETLDPRFYDQRHFWDGETRCICGWCNKRTGNVADDQTAARKTLGLPFGVAAMLFAANAGRKRDMISRLSGDTGPEPKDAARALRHLAVTGEVPRDW